MRYTSFHVDKYRCSCPEEYEPTKDKVPLWAEHLAIYSIVASVSLVIGMVARSVVAIITFLL